MEQPAAAAAALDKMELRVSAPGKLILFGEHAVVYGKTALAASLKLRSRLLLRQLPQAAEHCEIEMPAIGLSARLALSQLQGSLLLADKEQGEQERHEALLLRARELARDHALEPRQRLSLECALYALARVACAEGLDRLPGPFLLRLSSELPLGAGLGSSASFSVCLAAGFTLWARRAAELDRPTLDLVSCHALACERIMHGAPSGVDNEVCTFGSVIEFRKAEQPLRLRLAGRLAELRLLLVDTGVSRSTKQLVDKLAGLRDQYPAVYDSVFEAIDRLCRRVVDILKSPDSQLLAASRQLSTLIDVNQGLLTACQVSHPAIDSICATAKRHGLSAKLTGAGGGGFVYVLVPPDVTPDKLRRVTAELTDDGFSVIETNFSDSGLDAAISYAS